LKKNKNNSFLNFPVVLNVRQNIKYKETMTIVNNRTDEPIPQKQQENTKNI